MELCEFQNYSSFVPVYLNKIEKVYEEYKNNVKMLEGSADEKDIISLAKAAEYEMNNLAFLFPKENVVIDAAYLPKIPNFFQYGVDAIRHCTFKGDFSVYDFNHVGIFDCVFAEDAVLPNDKEFLQKLTQSMSGHIVFKSIDLTKYNIDNVFLDYFTFGENTVFPKERNFFKKLFRNAQVVELPIFDMNDYDWDDVIMEGVHFHPDTIFSADKSFFLNVKDKVLSVCTLPVFDYSSYDFKGVKLTLVEFPRGSKISDDRNFFQRLDGRCITRCSLPRIDMNNYDWNDVWIDGTIFTNDTILPVDREWMQKIKEKVLSEVHFPDGNYNAYNFRDVDVEGAFFTENTELPFDFLEQVYCTKLFGIESIVLPVSFIENSIVHFVPSKLTSIDLSRCTIPEALLILLHAKYKNDLRIELPPLAAGSYR